MTELKPQPAIPVFLPGLSADVQENWLRAHWMAYEIVLKALSVLGGARMPLAYERWIEWINGDGQAVVEQLFPERRARHDQVANIFGKMADLLSGNTFNYSLGTQVIIEENRRRGTNLDYALAAAAPGGNGIIIFPGGLGDVTHVVGLPNNYRSKGDEYGHTFARAFIIVHELAHAAGGLKGNRMAIDDKVYASEDCAGLARSDPDKAITNAQNYALFAAESWELADRARRAPPLGKTVTLHRAFGKYLSAQPDGVLIADRDKAAHWERYVVDRASDPYMSPCARPGASAATSPSTRSRTHAGSWTRRSTSALG
jgi:hypothetical protein